MFSYNLLIRSVIQIGTLTLNFLENMKEAKPEKEEPKGKMIKHLQISDKL